MLQRFYLIAAGAFYLGFSVPALVAPVVLMTNMGFTLEDVRGFSETRGIFGGVLGATGLFCIYAAYKPAFRQTAYIILILFNLGYVFGRTISLITDGNPGPIYLTAYSIEWLLFLSASWFYKNTAAEEEPATVA